MDSVPKEILLDYRLYLVLKHLDLAKVDYAKNVSKHIDIPISKVQENLKFLESLGLVSKFTKTSIKRRVAKLKLSPEVHKHHTYYEISKFGHQAIRSATPEKYLEILGPDCITLLSHTKYCHCEDQKCLKLVEMGLLDRKFHLTLLGNLVLGSAKSE